MLVFSIAVLLLIIGKLLEVLIQVIQISLLALELRVFAIARSVSHSHDLSRPSELTQKRKAWHVAESRPPFLLSASETPVSESKVLWVEADPYDLQSFALSEQRQEVRGKRSLAVPEIFEVQLLDDLASCQADRVQTVGFYLWIMRIHD